MQKAKADLDRIERLAGIRQVFVRAAEAAVMEANAVVLHWENTLAENARQIQCVREEIAQPGTAFADSIQNRERYLSRLKHKAEEIAQQLEKARKAAAVRNGELHEAMREQKVVAKVQERRLHEWRRLVDSEAQKAADELSIGRYGRNKPKPNTNGPDGSADAEPAGADAERRISNLRSDL